MGSVARQLLAIIDECMLDGLCDQVAILRSWLLQGRISEQQARAYLLALKPLIEQQEKHPNYLGSPEEEDFAEDPPDITLGAAARSDARFGLWLRDRARQCIVAGATGSGKTTHLRRIAINVADYSASSGHPTAIVVIDHKKDFRDLRRCLPGEWILLSVHDQLRLSLCPPRGVPLQAWIGQVSTCVSARAGLVAARRPLAMAMRWLFAVMNPEPTEILLAPSFKLILQVLQRSPAGLWTPKPEYLNSLISALQDITDNTGPLFDNFSGLDLDRDIIDQGRNIILGCEDITPAWIRLFMTDLFSNQILLPRLHRNEKTDSTTCCLVLDEADQDIARDTEAVFPGCLSPIGLLFKQGREFGCMTVVGVSFPKFVSPFVLANASDKFVFNQDDSESLFVAMNTLLMPENAAEMFPALHRGECIVRQAMSGYPKPFVGVVDYVAPDRNPSPPDDPCPHVPGQDLDEMPQVVKALDKLIAEYNAAKLRQSRSKGGLSANADKLLNLACVWPWVPVARLWDKIGRVAPSVQRSVRRELEDNNLAKFEEVRVSRRNVLLIDPLPKGYKRFGKLLPAKTGRGGMAHRHFSHWIAEVEKRRGHKGECEFKVPGTTHAVDAAAYRDGEWHAFEVSVTRRDNLASHIAACLIQSKAIATVTIVTTQVSIRDIVKQQIANDESLSSVLDRVHFAVGEPYLKELFG